MDDERRHTWKMQECWFGEGGCHDQVRWRVGVGEIAVRVVNPATPIFGDKPGSKLD